ncbi:DUF126 domain-containing protein [Brooklawnia sp.]|uniref:aconitase X swivel domain-containing protein n=1 Tax=Brooklawnia sp. TaxID=2699740 RepID=UPI00311FC3BB
MTTSFGCHVISEGLAEGEVLHSTDAICFYLVEPETGIVIESGHALEGKSVAGKVLVFPVGKGSSVVQADGLFQLLKNGKAPSALITTSADTTLVASAIILEIAMCDRLDDSFYQTVRDGDIVRVDSESKTVELVS